MEKNHKIFILSNLQTLFDFANSNLNYFYELAKTEGNMEKVLVYSNSISVLMELDNLVCKAKDLENI